jgi:ATP-dependent RNA helicase DeaD
VVVLDEADEMLDLGFREDLEALLAAAPATRRTLMFSATLPAPMRALAKRFQRDALAIDARRAGRATADGAQAGAHEDITYVAHLIAGNDRLAAVINVLRGSGASRAIVFCTTRDAVGGLHRELVARGFAATAISGERAQAERDRALDQLRHGEARILVATNVAARGLHLPDVDLIVHADLPLNVESLTHRSGRTGRAGRKGVAVVIASLAERRKAERLFLSARLRPEWTAPPSARAIAAAARTRLGDSLTGVEDAAGEAAETPGVAVADDELDLMLAELRERMPIDQLARRLLARELARLPVGEPCAGGARTDRNAEPLSARRRGPADFARESVLFRVNLGTQDQADPRWLLPLICRRGGVTRREVGAIRVGPHETLFEIAGDAAADYALSASQSDPRAPNVRVERVDGGGGNGARPSPARVERPERADRPERAERAGFGDRGNAPRPAQARAERPERAGFGGGGNAPRPAPARVERPERAPAGGGFQPPARRSPSGPPPAAARPTPAPARPAPEPAPAAHATARPAHTPARPTHASARPPRAPVPVSHAPARPIHGPARASHAPARPGHAPARPSAGPGHARPANGHTRPAHPPARPRAHPHPPHPRARKPRG